MLKRSLERDNELTKSFLETTLQDLLRNMVLVSFKALTAVEERYFISGMQFVTFAVYAAIVCCLIVRRLSGGKNGYPGHVFKNRQII